MSKLSGVAIWCALFACAGPAFAQDDLAQAEKLFRDGGAALKRGETDTACSMLDKSNALDPAIGTLGLLALCHERQGRIATSVAEYRTVASLASAANQPERAQIASARADELAPHVSHLELTLPDFPSNMSITLRGKPISRVESAAPIPLDPGPVLVEARAPGFLPHSETVTIGLDGATTQLLMPELSRMPAPAAEPAPVPAPAAEAPRRAPAEPAPDAPAAKGNSEIPTAAWAALGVGAVGLGVGGFFGVRALSSNSDSRSHCTNNDCDETGVDLRQTALHQATISTVACVVGAAGLAASIVIYATREREAPHLAAGFSAGPQQQLVSLHGSF